LLETKHDWSCSDRDYVIRPNSVTIDFEIGILWFSNKLAVLREKIYNTTVNYSL